MVLNTNLALLGIGLIAVFIGSLLIILSFLGEGLERKGRSEAGGVIIIGPVPVVFGSNKSAAMAAALVGIVLTALAIILFLILGGGHV